MLSEVERFVNWTRRRSPEARTWKDYGYDLHIFIQVVGDRPLKDITFRDIDHFVGVQSEKGFKPSTINRRLGLGLRSLMVVARHEFTIGGCLAEFTNHCWIERKTIFPCKDFRHSGDMPPSGTFGSQYSMGVLREDPRRAEAFDVEDLSAENSVWYLSSTSLP